MNKFKRVKLAFRAACSLGWCITFLTACSSPGRSFDRLRTNTADAGSACNKGELGCACYRNLTCDQGLVCTKDQCRAPETPVTDGADSTVAVVSTGEVKTTDVTSGLTTDVMATPTSDPTSVVVTSSDTSSEAPSPDVPDCTVVEAEGSELTNERAGFGAAQALAVFPSPTVSACVDDSSIPGTVCVSGYANAVEEKTEEGNWGVGLVLDMQAPLDSDALAAPLNAAELGVTSLRITVASVSGASLGVLIEQADDPRISEPTLNYGTNPFAWPKELETGPNAIALDSLVLSDDSRASIQAGLGESFSSDAWLLDTRQLRRVWILALNPLSTDVQPYSFCISGVEWLDSGGRVVAPGDASSDAPNQCRIDFPRYCDGHNDVRAGCWTADTDCSTTTLCDGGYAACNEGYQVNCADLTCVAISTDAGVPESVDYDASL